MNELQPGVAKAYPNDSGRGFARQNAEVGIGERVTIRKAEATKADSVVLAPPEEASVEFAADAAGMVKRQIMKRPFMRSPGDAIPLVAFETDPDGVVLVAEEPDVELREEWPGG